MNAHDPETCGVNPQTDCPECRPQTIRFRELYALEERLRKANISIRDLAELVWYHVEPMINDRIAAIAEEQAERKLRQLLSTLNFTWRLGSAFAADSEFNGKGKEG
jgi:hypothetical protein